MKVHGSYRAPTPTPSHVVRQHPGAPRVLKAAKVLPPKEAPSVDALEKSSTRAHKMYKKLDTASAVTLLSAPVAFGSAWKLLNLGSAALAAVGLVAFSQVLLHYAKKFEARFHNERAHMDPFVMAALGSRRRAAQRARGHED